jgi:hypothetical protein
MRGINRFMTVAITLTHNATDRRVIGVIDKTFFIVAASLESPPGASRCAITGRNTRNNNCSCR